MDQKQLEEIKKNCIFCKIARKEIQSHIVYEDDICFAILDINPITDGHILLCPKEHYMIMPLVPDEVLTHLAAIQKNLTNVVKSIMGAQDVNILIANGPAAGQQIMHFSIQIVPDYGNENISFNLDKEPDQAKLDEIKALLKKGIEPIEQQIKQGGG